MNQSDLTGFSLLVSLGSPGLCVQDRPTGPKPPDAGGQIRNLNRQSRACLNTAQAVERMIDGKATLVKVFNKFPLTGFIFTGSECTEKNASERRPANTFESVEVKMWIQEAHEALSITVVEGLQS